MRSGRRRQGRLAVALAAASSGLPLAALSACGLPLAALSACGPALADGVFNGTVIASDPSVIEESGTLRMSYTDYDWQSGRTVISVAQSPDGSNWTPVAASTSAVVRGAAISPEPGSWRENVEGSALLKTSGGYFLYFSGYRDEGYPRKGFPASIGLATSADGVRFEARPTPVIEPTRGWYDNDAAYSPAVVETADGFFLAYAGHAYTDASAIERPGVSVLGARSRDGVAWEKLEAPLLASAGAPGWMADGAAEPALLRLGEDRWLLLFTGLAGEERVIGVATGPAPEGPWRIGPEPLIVPGAPGSAGDHQVLAPSSLLDGERLRIWYLAASRSGALAVAYREAPLAGIDSR